MAVVGVSLTRETSWVYVCLDPGVHHGNKAQTGSWSPCRIGKVICQIYVGNNYFHKNYGNLLVLSKLLTRWLIQFCSTKYITDIHACHTETTTVVGSSYIWQKQTYGKLLAANLVNPVRPHRPEGSRPMLARWGQHRAGTGPADTTTREDSSLPPMTEPARSS